MLRWEDGMLLDDVELTGDLRSAELVGGLASFGEDSAGELYLVGLGGSIFRLEAE